MKKLDKYLSAQEFYLWLILTAAIGGLSLSLSLTYATYLVFRHYAPSKRQWRTAGIRMLTPASPLSVQRRDWQSSHCSPHTLRFTTTGTHTALHTHTHVIWTTFLILLSSLKKSVPRSLAPACQFHLLIHRGSPGGRGQESSGRRPRDSGYKDNHKRDRRLWKEQKLHQLWTPTGTGKESKSGGEKNGVNSDIFSHIILLSLSLSVRVRRDHPIRKYLLQLPWHLPAFSAPSQSPSIQVSHQ